MRWSFSQYLIFRECPRKWYFAYKMGYGSSAKEPIRKEAFYLKQLKMIATWRGIIADKVISEKIIPSFVKNSTISLDESLSEAKTFFDDQLAFAKERKWRKDGVKKSDINYLALWELEKGLDIREPLETAWSEIEIALTNFYQMQEIWGLFPSASQLIPQQLITFYLQDIYVVCQPDLIILFQNREPVIVDWKVHKFGVKDYRRQLALYALALTQSSKLKRKYPVELTGYQPTDIRLSEVQLLTNSVHDYELLDSDIIEIKDLIYTSNRKMKLTIADEDDDFSYLDVPITEFVANCQRCQFQSICQENSLWEQKTICQQSKQTSFLY
jgi:hypothetical protein